MARYVCDFDQVSQIGKAVNQIGDSMKKEIDTYSTKIENDLAGWSSATKDEFTSRNQEIVKSSINCGEYITSLGNFIVESSEKIQALEEQLAGLSI